MYTIHHINLNRNQSKTLKSNVNIKQCNNFNPY